MRERRSHPRRRDPTRLCCHSQLVATGNVRLTRNPGFIAIRLIFGAVEFGDGADQAQPLAVLDWISDVYPKAREISCRSMSRVGATACGCAFRKISPARPGCAKAPASMSRRRAAGT